MKPEQLHVFTCISNPIRWQTRTAHYKRFREHMLDSGVKLTTVECALGGRPHELGDDPHVNHVPVRADTLAWNKENLINIGIQRKLEPDDQFVAWIDADVEFRNRSWAQDTIHSLHQYPVVQPWSHALDLGPDGTPMTVKGRDVQTAFARVWRERGDIAEWLKTPGNEYSYPHPGYAWAIRRHTLNQIGGLIEVSGLGAGDHQMAMSFIDRVKDAIHGETHLDYQDAIKAWGHRAAAVVQGRVGYVTGTIEHWFHGSKPKRQYQDRWQILVKHGFSPVTDIKRNLHGVIELAGNKPAMEADFDRYFRKRDEDANIL